MSKNGSTFPEIVNDAQVRHVFVCLETQLNSLFCDVESHWEKYLQALETLTEDGSDRVSESVNKDMLKVEQLPLESEFMNAKTIHELSTSARINEYRTAVCDCHYKLLQREMEISNASTDLTKWKSGWQESEALK